MDQVQRAIYALADAAVALECLALALQVQRLPAERKRCCDWSVAENGAFLELWPHFTKPELAAIFGRTPGAIKSKAKQLKPGPKLPETDARATRCAARGNAGVFQPGHLPQTWVPIGTEIIDAYGYLKRKTRDGMQPAVYNFEFVHRLVWEQHHGPVPAGHKICVSQRQKARHPHRQPRMR